MGTLALRQRTSLRRGSNLRVPSTTIYRFTDTFARAGSVLGAPWTEVVENAGSGYGGQTIQDNIQYMVYTSYSSSQYHLTRISTPLKRFKEISKVEISFKHFCGWGYPHHNDSIKLLIGATPATRSGSAKGLGLWVVGGDRADAGEGAFKTSVVIDGTETSVATSGNAHVWRQIDFVAGNGALKIYNYADGGTRPETPTAVSNGFSNKYIPTDLYLVLWLSAQQVGDNQSGSKIKNLTVSITGC